MTREQLEIEVLKDYLRKWDFAMFPLLPVGEPEAEYILRIIEEKENRNRKRHEYYVANRETFISKSKENYEKKKAEAFIRGTKHD